MIHYTILDMGTVLEDPAGGCTMTENAVVGGVPVLLRRAANGGACIERVLSTDPADFLRPELTPGTAVVARDNGAGIAVHTLG